MHIKSSIIPLIKLTPSQTKALSTERHLAITANAGSGKTRVLVMRYVNLFLRYNGLTTRNVAAITFTENAASELRSKISEEINDRLKHDLKTTSEQRARLQELRDSLPSAFIGTIHGFASRLLRAYPVEANIDASFTILTGADQRLMTEDAIEQVFYSELDQAYQKPNENDVLHLFRTLGRGNTTELTRALLNNRMRAAKIRKHLLSKNVDEILSFWRKEFERVLSFCTSQETKSILNEVTGCLKSGKFGAGALEAIIPYLNTSEFFETVTRFANVTKSLIIKEGTLRKNVIDDKTTSPQLKEDIESFIEQVLPLRNLLDKAPKNEDEFIVGHTEYIALLRTVFYLYDQVLHEYSTAKNDFGLLDFDDLIERLLKLLENPQLCSEISNEFHFVMIDEYQDTDEGQFELAKKLTSHFGTGNNLAVVGDPKQAIYTFRNADAEVFAQTVWAIKDQTLTGSAEEESIRLLLSPDETRGAIVLAESFRMARTPLAAINLLFRRLMSDESVKYSELIHGRAPNPEGSVEWICPVTIKKRNNPESGKSEAEDAEIDEEVSTESTLIARKIQNILQRSDNYYNVEIIEGTRKIEYGDIAILLRSRGGLRAIERSLQEAHIPYVVSKGAGFFSQPEILDCIGYLKFLASPSDDIALAAILRSPFFAISDVELFQIGHHEASRRRSIESPWSFWQQFQSYTIASGASHLHRTAEQVRENLALAGRSSTALLLEKIYTETGIFASLQRGPQSAQKIANLEKFLAQARSADQSGFSGLLDFVERISYLAESEEQESQAEVSDELGSVRIMTVHAAKGLEFPVVILPFLQKRFNFDHQHLLDKELGLQIRVPDDRPQPLIGELIRERSKATTIAEEKRILYVAMTRARDHLLLSCTMPEHPSEHSWLSWICDAYGVPASDSPLTLHENVSHYDSDTQQSKEWPFQFEIPLIRSLTDIRNLSRLQSKHPFPFILIFISRRWKFRNRRADSVPRSYFVSSNARPNTISPIFSVCRKKRSLHTIRNPTSIPSVFEARYWGKSFTG